MASLKLKHINLAKRVLIQDPREVNTKFAKTISTWFFPVGGEARTIVEGWVTHLRTRLQWGDADPLFPATLMVVGDGGGFAREGLKRAHWTTADPIRRVFRQAFEAAGLRVLPAAFAFRRNYCRQYAWPERLPHAGAIQGVVAEPGTTT